jgi:GH25 family lysozyme M1 (1,4-beta-N-acetylmuramidase)
VTGTVTYLADCSSYQGVPDWAKAAAVIGGGAEKVTEGAGSTAYLNPDWAASKRGLLQMARHGFVPLAYLFLDAVEAGAAQAEWFARNAGDLAGFGIAVDFERAPNGNPTRAQARDAVAELRKLFPHWPIGGYCPHWYTGGEDLTFVDWLWASSYVTGSGDPALLYHQVPASWWAPYGGKSPLLLQFTDAATIAGISGPVDCSAFHGDGKQLAATVLPSPPKPAPNPSGASDMLVELTPGQPPVSIPVWAGAYASHEESAYHNCSLVFAGGTGAVVKATVYGGTKPEIFTSTLADGRTFLVLPKIGWHLCSVVEVQRLDTRTSVGASATFRTW